MSLNRKCPHNAPTFKLLKEMYLRTNIYDIYNINSCIFPKGVKKHKKSKATNPPSSGGNIITTNPAHLMQLGLAMLRRRGAAMTVVDGEEAPPGCPWYPTAVGVEAPEFLGQNLNPNNTKNRKIGKGKREFPNNMNLALISVTHGDAIW